MLEWLEVRLDVGCDKRLMYGCVLSLLLLLSDDNGHDDNDYYKRESVVPR